MSDYIIFADSNTDFELKMLNELDLKLVSLSYTIDGQTHQNYLDEASMTNKDFYKRLRAGSACSTTQVNAHEFKIFFEPYLKEGTDIMYIAFSSGLSGTYQSAIMAKEELLEKYPERKIAIVDSLSASMGEALLVYHAVQQKRAGLNIEQLEKWIIDNRLRLCHWFTVDDLHHLKRGGRVSAAAAVVGTMLAIKPVLHVDDEGHLIPVAKVRGRRQSLDALVKQMEDTAINPKHQTVFISHGDCLEDAQYVAKQIKAKFDTKDIHIGFIGPVIGSHSGPGTVALFFLGAKR